MTPILGATCDICGERVGREQATLERRVCVACTQEPPHFTKAVAYGPYDSELRELIHLLKYEQVETAASLLGRMLAEAIEKLNIAADRVLVLPVPLHRSKRRQRGFNQAELIARAAMKRCAFEGLEFTAGVLERTRSTVSQIGLTRAQRAENIRGAFRMQHLNRIKGRDVLLVDDVLTTGTTANECARVLRRAGAERVWVATVARTLKENAALFAGEHGDAVSGANIARA